MISPVQEIVFDIVVAVACTLAVAAYMLGLLLDPLPAVALGGFLIVVGTVILVPRKAWSTASLLGVGALIFTGILVPRFVVELMAVADEMPLTIALSGGVLIGTFVALHFAAFQPHNLPTA